MHYILKEHTEVPHEGNQTLICLFHGGFTFYCKTDSTKDRNKRFYNLLIQTSERKAKIGKKNKSNGFYCFYLYHVQLFSMYQKINSTISIHIDSTKLSPQVISLQKEIVSIKQDNNNV